MIQKEKTRYTLLSLFNKQHFYEQKENRIKTNLATFEQQIRRNQLQKLDIA